MSKIHVLDGDGNTYNIIVHFATVTGNNSASKTWKSVGLKSGYTGFTTRLVGTGPGDITQIEHDSITSGDTVEISIQANDNSTADEVNILADAAITEWKKNMSIKLKWYGLQLG